MTRENMLMAIDIGNTNIALGVFFKNELYKHWHIKTEHGRTADEYSVLIQNLFSMSGLKKEQVTNIIFSCVVPPLTPVFYEIGFTLFQKKPLVVGPGLKTGMPILYENPQDVGADRIVASVAAKEKYSCPLIICDFGTAATFDALSSEGEYLGGAIAPGIQISAEALYLKTAKLQHVEVKKPERVIGRSTVLSIQSGLYFGYIGLVKNIIKKMKEEIGGNVTVISTGGFAEFILNDIDSIDHLEPHLVLNGLRILYEKNS